MATNSAGFRFVEIGSSNIDHSLDFYRSMEPRLGLRGVGIGVAGPLVTNPDGVSLQVVTAG